MNGAHAADRPVVSVIVPAYNAAEFLEAAIERLLQQTLARDSAAVEIIVVDDGSTDATAAIGARAAATHAGVHFFQQEQNGGVARARARAAAVSRGEFLWFVDCDDDWADSALEKLVAAARSTGADVVVCGAEYVYPGQRRALAAPTLAAAINGAEAFRLLLDGEITGHLWNKLFRRELTLEIEFTPARVHSDLAMVAQLLAAADRVVAISDVLYSYVVRGGSIIRSGSRRAESLLLVEQAVTTAAITLDTRIIGSNSYGYFRLRYVLLSGLKDALSGPYDAEERDEIVAELRSRLTWRLVLLAARRRDWKRLALAGTAKVSMPLHRRILRLAAEQGAA
ncbi:MAG: glycosyltransferase [Cryobacterium sp.]|uniref:glycosyltransferase family 2 protein n=1 Tax=unclassified Cryobacterium TaxID=2649013 RepID=UPI0018CB329C|nr:MULTISPECIES: glycosyltransferase [unclassified Cryobacterium]MCY7405473.1 glycosyltransferase [Cryobacterium sp.]MEC5153502.1 glycosyltransferase involved in cell wall biosynthesis [Cryobacterium sp. CAN_C3]